VVEVEVGVVVVVVVEVEVVVNHEDRPYNIQGTERPVEN